MPVRRPKPSTRSARAKKPSESAPDLGKAGVIPPGFNPEANSQEMPIPVKDGEHFSEVSVSAALEPKAFKGKEDAKLAVNRGVMHWVVPLEFKVIGAKDSDKGKKHFGQVFTSWRETSEGLTNQVVDLIKILGGNYRAAGDTTKAKDMLVALLKQRKHSLKVKTQWQAQYTDKVKGPDGKRLYVHLKGMGNFPQKDGNPAPIDTDDQGRSVRTVAELLRFSAPDE